MLASIAHSVPPSGYGPWEQVASTLTEGLVRRGHDVTGVRRADHELDADDPMTYLDLGSSKRFQNNTVNCGEVEGQPFTCRCGNTTQNSFAYMRQQFGLSPPLAVSPVRAMLGIGSRSSSFRKR